MSRSHASVVTGKAGGGLPGGARYWSPARRVLGAALALVLLILMSPGYCAEADDASSSNPSPRADDILLPMPCGGTMAFRAVAVSGDGFAGQREVELGEQVLADDRYTALVTGPFGGVDGVKYLLIGKYEVSQRQYLSLTRAGPGGECKALGADSGAPVTEVSWVDALAFARGYSRWLDAGQKGFPDCVIGARAGPCVPRVDGRLIQLRLPTAEEWEFSARGGTQVSEWDFREWRFPMSGSLERYAWFLSNTEGAAMPIGTRAPNPLGLHDMLGNVEEWMLEPFRLHVDLRRHGLVGACEVRGGSFTTPPEALRTAMRREVDCYTGNGDLGFRLVAAVPVNTSDRRLHELRTALEKRAPIQRGADPAGGDSAQGAIHVEADVEGDVLVDGAAIGRVTPGAPMLVSNLKAGEHFVSIAVADGRRSPPKRYIVASNEITTVSFVVRGGLDLPSETAAAVAVERRTPEAWEASLGFTREEKQRIESWLRQRGYHTGPEDGIFDNQTREAVKEMQRQYGLEATGYVSATLYDLLSKGRGR